MYWKSVCVIVVGILALGGCSAPEPPVAEVGVEPAVIQLGYPEVTRVSLRWKLLEPLEGLNGSPRVFLHLLDGEGKMIRTFDHPFPADWQAGEEHEYEVALFQSALVPALDHGRYSLTVGLYDAGDSRWSLAVDGEEIRSQEYVLAQVEAGGAENVPEFFFSAAWLPVEGGTDLQVLTRRWLGEDGVLRLAEVPGAGSLRLLVGIPSPGEGQELVQKEDTTQPAVVVSSTCGEVDVELNGSGSHAVDLAIEPSAEGGDCEVSFTANYYLLSLDDMSRRTLALENLSWEPLG